MAEGVVGVLGEVELVAEGFFPVGVAEGFGEHGGEEFFFVGVEVADGGEDVVFEEDEVGVVFIAVGDGVVHHAHGESPF